MNARRQENMKKTAAVHRDNIRKSLEHRIAVARANGDENLVRLLEAEASHYN